MDDRVVRVDSVALTGATDFAALAREVLLGGGGAGSLRADAAPVDWVFRAYRELAGTPYRDRLARGVAACLTAAEPEVRAQALVFVQAEPKAAGAGRVVELVAGDRAQFAGVPDPLHPGVDLEWQLLAALAGHLDRADAFRLACAEVVRPGRAGPLVAALSATAPDWVVAHAEEIVRGTAAAGLTILIALQGRHDVADLGRRIAPLCRPDPRFETDAARFIDDAATRQAILAAYRG